MSKGQDRLDLCESLQRNLNRLDGIIDKFDEVKDELWSLFFDLTQDGHTAEEVSGQAIEDAINRATDSFPRVKSVKTLAEDLQQVATWIGRAHSGAEEDARETLRHEE